MVGCFFCFFFKFLMLKYPSISVLKLDILNSENGTVTEWYIIVHVFISSLVFIFSINVPVLARSWYSFVIFFYSTIELDIFISLGMISLYIEIMFTIHRVSFLFTVFLKYSYISWKWVYVSSYF